MAAQPEIPQADTSAARIRPIELLTENGFIILRPWEIDGVPPPISGIYRFRVCNPQNVERDIIVELADAIVARVAIQTGGAAALPRSSLLRLRAGEPARFLRRLQRYRRHPDERA